MRVVSKSNAGAALVFLVAPLPCFGVTPALAQNGVPPADQYGLPSEKQYNATLASTTPLPEDQYDAVPEDQLGGVTAGGTTAAPVVDGNNDSDGNGDDGADEAVTPNRPASDTGGNGTRRLFNGLLFEAAVMLAALSLITTLFFFLERSWERRRAWRAFSPVRSSEFPHRADYRSRSEPRPFQGPATSCDARSRTRSGRCRCSTRPRFLDAGRP